MVSLPVVVDELWFALTRVKLKTQAIDTRNEPRRKHMIIKTGKPQHIFCAACRNVSIGRRFDLNFSDAIVYSHSCCFSFVDFCRTLDRPRSQQFHVCWRMEQERKWNWHDWMSPWMGWFGTSVRLGSWCVRSNVDSSLPFCDVVERRKSLEWILWSIRYTASFRAVPSKRGHEVPQKIIESYFADSILFLFSKWTNKAKEFYLECEEEGITLLSSSAIQVCNGFSINEKNTNILSFLSLFNWCIESTERILVQGSSVGVGNCLDTKCVLQAIHKQREYPTSVKISQ